MTIALGVICDSGIVVAADTEESIPGVMKRDQEKIQVLLTRHGASGGPFGGEQDVTIRLRADRAAAVDPPDTDIAITGAGTAGYIDALVPRLTKVFTDNPWVTDEEELRSRIEVVVRRFFKENIIPFAAYPPGERPEVEMLLAYERAGVRRILISDKTAVRSVRQGEVVAIGSGAFFVKMLLRAFDLGRGLDARTAQLLAAYAVFRAKEFIDGCGKYTTMAVLPHAAALSQNQIVRLETLFRQHTKVESRTLGQILRYPKNEALNPADLYRNYVLLQSTCDGIVTPLDLPTNRASLPTRQGSKRGRKRQPPSRE